MSVPTRTPAFSACWCSSHWLGGRGAGAQYLAVFVDGRMLPVQGARLLDERRIRLELPNGGAIEVPVTRVDRIIEDAVEPDPQPVPEPPPSCPFAFAEQALPEKTPFAAEIAAAAKAADLHPGLVVAVVQAESAFQPYAISRVGRGRSHATDAVRLARRRAADALRAGQQPAGRQPAPQGAARSLQG